MNITFKNTLLPVLSLLFTTIFHIHVGMCQTLINVEFFTQGQRYGVFEIDYFIISDSPGGLGVIVEGENPTSSTTGKLIFRKEASQFRTWGPIGAHFSWPYSAQVGSVNYDNVVVSGTSSTYYISIRYSKFSAPSTPVDISINGKVIATFTPENQRGWENFSMSPSFSFNIDNENCGTPSGVSSRALNNNSASISWNNDSAINYYFVRIQKEGTQVWNEFSTASSPLLVAGLTPSSTYHYQVRGFCCEYGYTNWTDTMSFSLPSNFDVGNIFKPLKVSGSKVDLYPNPTNDWINVKLDDLDASHIQITNRYGLLWYAEPVTSIETKINTHALPKGLYFLSIFSKDGPMKTQSFLKQ